MPTDWQLICQVFFFLSFLSVLGDLLKSLNRASSVHQSLHSVSILSSLEGHLSYEILGRWSGNCSFIATADLLSGSSFPVTKTKTKEMLDIKPKQKMEFLDLLIEMRLEFVFLRSLGSTGSGNYWSGSCHTFHYQLGCSCGFLDTWCLCSVPSYLVISAVVMQRAVVMCDRRVQLPSDLDGQ